MIYTVRVNIEGFVYVTVEADNKHDAKDIAEHIVSHQYRIDMFDHILYCAVNAETI